MGVHSQWKLYTQRRLELAGKLPKQSKRAYTDNNLEIQMLAENFHLSLGDGSKQNLNMG